MSLLPLKFENICKYFTNGNTVVKESFKTGNITEYCYVNNEIIVNGEFKNINEVNWTLEEILNDSWYLKVDSVQ